MEADTLTIGTDHLPFFGADHILFVNPKDKDPERTKEVFKVKLKKLGIEKIPNFKADVLVSGFIAEGDCVLREKGFYKWLNKSASVGYPPPEGKMKSLL